MATSNLAELRGRVLSARYRLTRPLGSGASAAVYLADDVALGRPVAVKVLHPALADDRAFLRRFHAEAQLVAGLRHPNIVRVYDWGEDDGTPYLVTELLAGGSLRSLLDHGRLLTPAQAARVGAEAAAALDYAHKRGLVHRDVKPANLLLDEEGHVSVADFGVARALAEATWTEPIGAMLGTARYAAPEQAEGSGALDGRADVYALALVLVEAVTGRVPFAADTTIGTLMARMGRPLPVPDELGELRAALEEAGRADPDARADATRFAELLGEATSRLPAPAPLPLAGPLITGTIDLDDAPTASPGRPKLFDLEAVEADAPTGASEADIAVLPDDPRTVAPPVPREDPDDPTAPVGRGRQAPGAAAWPSDETDADGADTTGRRRRRVSRRAERAGKRADRGVGRRRWPRVLGVVLVVALLAGAGVATYLVVDRPLPLRPVPTLAGRTVAQARALLAGERLGLVVGDHRYSEQVAKGLIISQQPAGGRLREHKAVTVIVSDGLPPVTVPDLTGLTPAQAQLKLSGAGFKLGTQTLRFSATVPRGQLISWTGEGHQLIQGATVDVVVSNGPPTVGVPNVASKAFADAQTALAAVNLTAVESDQYNDTVPKGEAISTDPAVGATVPSGSKVTVYISLGPQLVAIPASVKGQGIVQATATLQAAGLTVSGVDGSPTLAVTGTIPAIGTEVRLGTAITLVT